MKLESLAIIFLIIIMPISIVLSEYIDNKIKIAETELIYDTRLLNATHDAIKAYQLNTVNNAFGDAATRKVKDIEAAANTFFTSLTSSFNYIGNKSDTMKEFVPAIVFTLYDGYYIYSPFTNTLTEVPETNEKGEPNIDESYSTAGEIKDGLKPYVFYSCRYVRDNDDFIITYTLDNYITIQGYIKGNYVNDYGYLNTGIIKNSDKEYEYDGVKFKESETETETLKEYVGDTEYPYIKENGQKYYLDSDYGKGLGENGAGIFIIDQKGNKNYSPGNSRENYDGLYNKIMNNNDAYEYYKDSYEFTNKVLKTYGLNDLKVSDAYIWNNPADGTTSLQEYYGKNNSDGNKLIFASNNTTKIENSASNFNEHRKLIIRYTVETNLITAIQSFSDSAGEGANFIMPKISEDDWEIIEDNVCAISFMQGLSLGSKRYNSYSVVANTLTNEYVDENDIYILAKDKNDTRIYCKPNDITLLNEDVKILNKNVDGMSHYAGVWKLNLEQKQDVSTGTTKYYIPLSYMKKDQDGRPIQMGYLGSYTSIYGSTRGSVADINGDMYNYMKTLKKSNEATALKKAYYYGLARERYGSYHVNN